LRIDVTGIIGGSRKQCQENGGPSDRGGDHHAIVAMREGRAVISIPFRKNFRAAHPQNHSIRTGNFSEPHRFKRWQVARLMTFVGFLMAQ
jgi:hypothetical protein